MALQRLNIQAHINAASHSEEFVAESMAVSGAINTVVHNLITHEVTIKMQHTQRYPIPPPGVVAARLPTP